MSPFESVEIMKESPNLKKRFRYPILEILSEYQVKLFKYYNAIEILKIERRNQKLERKN